MAKPSSNSDWCVGNPSFGTVVTEPTAGKKQTGWTHLEKPPYQYMNWLFYIHDAWIKYLNSQTSYDIIVGSGSNADYANLTAAIADGSLTTNVSVLVTDGEAIAGPVTLNKAGWRIHCAPGVLFTKDTGTIAFTLDAERIEFYHGRFTGYTAGGDIVFNLTANADYCKIIGVTFGASTDTEVDDSLVTAGKLPVVSQTITEV